MARLVYVQIDYTSEKVYDEFAQKLSNAVSKFEVGDGFNENVTLGPLITEDAVLKVENHINDALSKGAKLITGGSRHKLGGNFFEPTLLTEVTKNMVFLLMKHLVLLLLYLDLRTKMM